MTMPKIFICYRREDSQWPAQWIYNDLTKHFGVESVVFDVDTIPPGTDFREYLNEEVSKCDILLTVIGDQWLEILKQRHDEPKDFVRIEIQAALEREIPVVPILVGKASVPNEKNLPPELAGLAYKQAAEVRVGSDLQNHLKRLIDRLDHALAEQEATRKAEEERKQKEAKGFSNTTVKAKVSGRVEIGRDENFIAFSNGVVLDTKTDLEWVAGPDKWTSWKKAKSWVKSLKIDGGCWRMPTMDELEALYKEGAWDTDNQTALLHNGGWNGWAAETVGWWKDIMESGGMMRKYGSFSFLSGNKSWATKFNGTRNYRAFAVRSRR
jgi:hypothetical protein